MFKVGLHKTAEGVLGKLLRTGQGHFMDADSLRHARKSFAKQIREVRSAKKSGMMRENGTLLNENSYRADKSSLKHKLTDATHPLKEQPDRDIANIGRTRAVIPGRGLPTIATTDRGASPYTGISSKISNPKATYKQRNVMREFKKWKARGI